MRPAPCRSTGVRTAVGLGAGAGVRAGLGRTRSGRAFGADQTGWRRTFGRQAQHDQAQRTKENAKQTPSHRPTAAAASQRRPQNTAGQQQAKGANSYIHDEITLYNVTHSTPTSVPTQAESNAASPPISVNNPWPPVNQILCPIAIAQFPAPKYTASPKRPVCSAWGDSPCLDAFADYFARVVMMGLFVPFQPPPDEYANHLALPQPERLRLPPAPWLLLLLIILCLIPRQ